MRFKGEFYKEILDLNGKKFEHVGFRSFDGKFEKLLGTLPENFKLPLAAELNIEIDDKEKRPDVN